MSEDDVHNDRDGVHDNHEVQLLFCDNGHDDPHTHHDNIYHKDCVLDVGDDEEHSENDGGGGGGEDLRLAGVDGADDACDLVPGAGCHDPQYHDKRPQCNKEK